jgi:hypothetical protein
MRRALLVVLLAGCNVPLETFRHGDRDAGDDAMLPDHPFDVQLAQRAYVKASNTGAGDGFGGSVALSGDGQTLAIGAPHEAGDGSLESNDDDGDAGAVYVFRRTGQAWAQEAYLKAAHPDRDDFFGCSVALSGDGSILAVGAYSEDGAAVGVDGNDTNEAAPAAGAAFVFHRTGDQWRQQAYVKASNTGAEDGFGKAVALDDDGATLAVGAYREDSGRPANQTDETSEDSGAIYVFTRSDATWSQQAYVKAKSPVALSELGGSLALSGDGQTLVAGAVREGDPPSNDGMVYVFTRGATAWTQQRVLTSALTGPLSGFGTSLALSIDGATLAIGAPHESGPGGAIYVLVGGGATWTPQFHLAGDAGQLGTSIALSGDGNTLAAGAAFDASGATGVDGNASDTTAAQAGAVFVLARSGTTWTRHHYVKASNTGAGDQFGASVALARDGTTLAVGAIAEDSRATGVDDQAPDTADDSGAAYVFR